MKRRVLFSSLNLSRWALAIWCLLILASSASAQPRRRLPAGLLEIYEQFSRAATPSIPSAQRPIPQKGDGRKDAVDPAFQFLEVAYNALRIEDFDTAIAYLLKANAASPTRTDILKQLGYTYYLVGSDDLALAQFQQVIVLDPTDYQSALEVAFVTYESTDPGQLALARRIFLQISQVGDPVSKATAQAAFQNIDSGLASQIASLQQATQLDPNDPHTYYALGQAAEERDDFDLAVQSYQASESLGASVYIDLARVLTTAGRLVEARAALVSASQGSDPYSAEEAKDQLQQLGGN